jgi:hypothetical protein
MLVLSVLSVMNVAAGDPGPKSDRDVYPVYYDGNPQGGPDNTNAGYFNETYEEFRISDPSSGTYSDGYLKIIIIVENTNKGQVFDWEIADDSFVKALPGIFVKGGPGGNWYDYEDFEDVPGVIGADWDGYLHSPLGAAGGRKFYGLSHISFAYIMPEFQPDAYITIEADATNEVGDSHTFTVTVWEDVGSGFVPAADEWVTVSFESINGADPIADDSGWTDINGEFTTTINSDNAGQIIATASCDVDVDGTIVSRTTDGIAPNSGPATKTYVDAYIEIAPDDTNLVGIAHLFTITVWEDAGDGAGFVAAAGETVDVTFVSMWGADAQSPATCITNSMGTCTVSVNSDATGQIEATASSYVSVGGLSLYRETDGVSPNSGPATKTYVDARIGIVQDAVNAVGNEHTFTITLMRDLGEGAGYEGFEGQTVTASLSGVGYFVGGNSDTTDSNGQASVTINSDDPGTSTVTASWAGEIVAGYADTYLEISTDGTEDNSDPVVKTWWVGRITLTPATDTNEVNDPHEVTAHVEYSDDGSTWMDVEGALVTFSLSDGDAYFVGGIDTATTGADGTCSVWINKPTGGTVIISASSDFTVDGIDGTFSVATGTGYSGDDVEKIYVDAYITISPDDTNLVGVSHDFTVTVWENDGTGFVRAEGETVTVSFQSLWGADTIAPVTGTTDVNGEFTVTVNSDNTGQIVASASSTVSVDGFSLYRETDGVSPNSGPATKTYVDAKISIACDDDNVVGYEHMFTITLMCDLGDGAGWVGFGGQTVTASLSGVGYFVGGVNTDTTAADGTATVTINSDDPGQSTVTASWAGEIVAGFADTYLEISTDGTGDNSEPAVKTWWVGRITLTPATDTNEVNDPHEVTAHVEYSGDGSTWMDVEGALVTFSLSDGDAYFVGGIDTATTGADGTCSVWINKPTAGTVTISASSDFTIDGIDGTFSVATGTGYSGDDVEKIYVDAYITISPDDTNLVGISHDFTVTVWENAGDGAGFVRAQGETVTVSFQSLWGADTIAPVTGTTDVNGEITVTVNSDNTGQIVATASSSVSVGGLSLYRETDGVSPNSGPATKTYVDARISIAEDDDNVVGLEHTFTILLERDLGQGDGWEGFGGQTVTASLSGVGYFVGGSTATTDVDGYATVTINSDDPGTSTVSASFSGEIVPGYADTQISITTDGTNGNSEPAVKTWWVGRITLTPATDTNGITEPHEITAHVEYSDDGSTWMDVPAALVTFSLTDSDGDAYFVGGVNTATTDTNGLCSVWINKPTAGTVTIDASSDFTIGGIDGTFSVATGTGYSGPAAEKIYLDASLAWEKHDNEGQPLGGATFEVTRTHDREGYDIPDETITVLDNDATDQDPDDGEFLLTGLKFGTYTIKEIQAPEGYTLDFHVETVLVTDLNNPDVVVGYIWVNWPGRSQLCPTDVEPDEFLSGTAPDLVLTVNKRGKVAPGAFFHYTWFRAVGDTTIVIETDTSDGQKDARAVSAWVYIIDPDTGLTQSIGNEPGVDITIVNNVVTITVPEEYVEMSEDGYLVTRVRYKPADVPAGTTLTFDTTINGYLVFRDEITVIEE